MATSLSDYNCSDRTAWHECGHAAIVALLGGHVTAVKAQPSSGLTEAYTTRRLSAALDTAICLSGFAAEKVFCNSLAEMPEDYLARAEKLSNQNNDIAKALKTLPTMASIQRAIEILAADVFQIPVVRRAAENLFGELKKGPLTRDQVKDAIDRAMSECGMTIYSTRFIVVLAVKGAIWEAKQQENEHVLQHPEPERKHWWTAYLT